jgi:HAE1 family hydrophobic/amphiphilic exporter-1
MNITNISVKKPVTTSVISFALIILGFICLNRLSINFLPELKVPSITIKTVYPSASPLEVEKLITEPIEARMNTIGGVKKVSSISREGISLVTIDFNWNVDMDYVMFEIREKLDQLRSSLPQEAKRPTILRIDPSTESMMMLAISSKNEAVKDYNTFISETEMNMLKEFARSVVKRRLEQIDGVALADISGGVEKEIIIKLDKTKIELFGIHLSDLQTAIQNSNVSISGGTIKQGNFRFSIKAIGELKSIDDIQNIVVKKNNDGSFLLLKDIAKIEEGYQERTGITRFNGNETVGLVIYKEANSNTIETSQKVHKVVEEINKENKDLHTVIVFDQAEFISKSLNDVKNAIFQGAFLAFIVLFIFLKDFRNPIIIVISVPVTIAITFTLMYFYGININIISLTGLGLGIGMLGDNAIIVIENATRLRESGYNRIDAAIVGGSEINLAAAVSTLTNVAIFLPVLYVEGIAKELFKDMALTMTFSLIASLITAMTLVPMLVSREKNLFFKIKKQNVIIEKIKNIFLSICGWFNLRNFFDLQWHHFTNWYSDKLEYIFKKRKKVIVLILLLFVITLVIAYFIPSQSTPEIDQQRFTLDIELPKGSSLEVVDSYTNIIVRKLLSFPEVEAVISRTGIVEEQSVFSAIQTSLERSVIDVKIKEDGKTFEILNKIRDYIAEIKKNFPDFNISLRRKQTTFEQILRPEPFDIKLIIEGKDLNNMISIADSIQSLVGNISGIVDVRGGMQKGNPEYKITINKEKCAFYNIPTSEISSIVSFLTKGNVITTFNDFDKKINIRLKTNKPICDISEILDYRIETKNCNVPLRELVLCERSNSYSEIWRENQKRVVLITANLQNINISNAIDRINKIIKKINLPDGYFIRIGGENEEIKRSFNSLILILLLSVILVFILLAAEFESLKAPLIIILTSPLALIGAIFTMVLFGESYNLMSIIGIVIMTGAVDNDAVIATDFINLLRKQNYPLLNAIKLGMQKRLRSIIMTTATSVLGLLPLIFMSGESSSLAKSLSYPIAGGLITSTIFTLIIIPIVYLYFYNKKE